jgi:hypothetical protein
MDLQNYLASGGVSGAIIAGLYIAYKCCYRRKFHSKCCGGEMDVGSGQSSPETKEAVFEPPRIKTPKPSPALTAQHETIDVPKLELDS